jgi:hypothetical protein
MLGALGGLPHTSKRATAGQWCVMDARGAELCTQPADSSTPSELQHGAHAASSNLAFRTRTTNDMLL